MKKISTLLFSLCLLACNTPNVSPVTAPNPASEEGPETAASPTIKNATPPVPDNVTPEESQTPVVTPQTNLAPNKPPTQDLSRVQSLEIIATQRYVNGEGESIQLTPVLKDSNGELLDASQFPLSWLSSRPQDFSIDQSGKAIALTDYGYTRITLSLAGTPLTSEQLLSVNAPSSNIRTKPVLTTVTAPTLTSSSPIAGQVGSQIVLTGKNFSNATKVFFGNTPASAFTINSDTQITATVPEGTGTVNLSVSNNRGTSPTIDAAKYIYTLNSYTYSWPAAQSRTRTPAILSGLHTTFSAYSSSFTWNYLNLPFTVPVTGNYTFEATSSPVVNTSWILQGTFEPSVSPTVDPVTALSNFMFGNFSGNTAVFTEIALEAGQQYTFLTAFNNGGTSDDTVTVTVTGPAGAGFLITPTP